MKTINHFKSFITLAAASLVVGTLIVLPIIAGAQPAQAPTGGNVDAEFNTVSSSKYFDLDDPNYFLDPTATPTSLATKGDIYTAGNLEAIGDIYLEGAINSGNPLNAIVVNGNLAFAGYLFSYNPGTPVQVYDNDGFQIGTTTGVDSIFIAADGTISDASGKVKIDDINGVVMTGGNVGIGTSSPQTKLDVQGNATINGDLEVTKNITIPFFASATAGVIYKGVNIFLHNYGGNYSTFLGQAAGNLTMSTSKQNTGIGGLALYSLTTGSNNVALGVSALSSNSTGNDNVAIGNGALNLNRDGYNNVALGIYSLNKNISGDLNVAVGRMSGQDATGNRNTFIGDGAGMKTTGDANVFLGYSAGQNETGSNKLYIDNTSTATPLIYGDFGTNVVGINGNLGIGTNAPAAPLHVVDPANNVVGTFGAFGIGVTAIGDGGGGLFDDANSSGQAKLANDHVGVTAHGNVYGGYFSDNAIPASETGKAIVGANNYGINASGNDYGGYFADMNSTGYAYIGYGMRPIDAYGSNGGKFTNTNTGSNGEIAHLQSGVVGYGPTQGGYFADLTQSGYARIGSADTGVMGYGNTMGGYFQDRNNTSTYANIANGSFGVMGYGAYGVYGSGATTGGYFRDSTSSKYAYVGYDSWALYGSGNIKVWGTVYGTGGWSDPSDLRLKDVKGEYQKGLSEILELKPIEYRYKVDNEEDLPSDIDYVGFIAQDVQEIFPEAISENDNGYLNLTMHPIAVAVVTAIQELKSEKDDEVAKLKEEIAKAEKKVAALQSVVCELKPEADICNQ